MKSIQLPETWKPKGVSPRRAALTVGIFLMLGAAILLVLFFFKKTESTRINGGLYTYFGEVKLEYTGNSTLERTDEGTTIKNGGEKKQLDSRPLYREGADEAVLATAYVWLQPDGPKMCRVEAFSELTYENNGVTIRDGSLSAAGARGFLYDGEDTYIFLEPATVTAGDETIRVPAMSFAVVRYGETMNLYLKGESASRVIQLNGAETTASFEGGASVNLGTDTVYLANGSWMLLITRPELLDRMK